MGLIKAAFGSAGGVLADQWKEFFYCDALDKNTLVVRGQKKTTRRSSNTKGNDNVISNGSGIAVADGQCMIIVDQGKVAEICAEPGEFTWDSSSEPSVFTGKFGDSLKKTFTAIGKRFSYGGDPGKDQRVYYFNTKEILDNKFGTATPIDFRVVDSRVGIDRDVRLRVNGTYSYRISDPILFYTNVCGNVAGSYERSELDGQLKTEFVSALMPAVGRMSELELRPNQLMNHTKELRDYLNQELTAEWAEKRGLSVVSVALGGVTLSEEDAELLKIFERTYGPIKRDPLVAFRPTQKREHPDFDVQQWEILPEYLLVDGYNIIFAWDELNALAKDSLEAARHKLMDILCNYQGYQKCNLILVFDAYRVPGSPGSIEQYHNIHVVYTKEAETADMFIEHVTHEIGKGRRVRVATSDGMEQIIILGHGALRVSARMFHEEVQNVEKQIRALVQGQI